MGGTGYTVDSEELRSYANKLRGQYDTANGIGSLVDDADVSDQSWGIVGLFVKESYTEMLGELKSMFESLENGLEQGAHKFNQAAKGYEEWEQKTSELLNGIKGEIDGG